MVRITLNSWFIEILRKVAGFAVNHNKQNFAEEHNYLRSTNYLTK